jgi:glucokinase
VIPRMGKSEKSGLPVLAVDLGGTKILTAIISDTGRVIAKKRHTTLADEGPQKVINRLSSAIDQILSLNNIGPSQLDSIAIGAAGAVDSDKGVITLSPNLRGWNDISLGGIIQEQYQVDTFLLNDASAAALGEHRFGVGRGTRNLVLLTVGTGIGGGIIIDGELYLGSNGSAGEVGHMVIDVNGPRCACGQIGCWEALASGTAMARDAIRRIGQGERSSLVGVVGGKMESITAEKIGVAAKDRDALAMDVVRRAATYLGIGITNLVNIFNPDMIVISGGVAKLGDLLLGPARQVVEERAFPIAARTAHIVAAQLGGEAGVCGAAIFAREQKARSQNKGK